MANPTKITLKRFPMGFLLLYCNEFRSQNPATCNRCPAKREGLCINRSYIDLDMLSENINTQLENPLAPGFKGLRGGIYE